MKQWLPQGNGEHELTRKGIDNMLLILLLIQLSKLTVDQPSILNITLQGHIYTHSLH